MFKYGMRLRGFAPGCQPKGVDHVEEDPSGRYWDIVVYKEPLPEGDLIAFDLDYLGEV